jgi:ATP-binding protein involved in chromosome partitioning
LADRLPGVRRVVAVASGKGGVGKTTVTVNLSLALAQAGYRVGLFDADIWGPNVPLMLGVHGSAKAKGLLPVGRSQNKPYIPPLERFGIKVMSVGLLVGEDEAIMPDSGFAGLIVTRTLKDVLWGDLDYLLIDFPPGTGEPQSTLLHTVFVDGVIVVTTPQDLSLLDAGRSLGMFKAADVPVVGLIENMSYLMCPDCGAKIEVFHRSGRHWALEGENLAILGRVPLDLDISRSIDAGHPLLKESPSGSEAAIFADIAARVAHALPVDATR